MALTNVPQILSTVSDVMGFIAPNSGGSIPSSDSDEYKQWLLAIQIKQEEAGRRGFWRRLLTKDILSLRIGDTEATLPIRFQRANSLYILVVNGVDLGDPDRTPDNQSAVPQMINDPEDEEFGLWKVIFKTPIETDEDAVLWYFATPPKPVAATDKLLLPGDMVAFGALQEIFRAGNLPGSQDSAQTEFEHRLETYLNLENIPPRNELLTYTVDSRKIDRSERARAQYYTRPSRTGRRT